MTDGSWKRMDELGPDDYGRRVKWAIPDDVPPWVAPGPGHVSGGVLVEARVVREARGPSGEAADGSVILTLEKRGTQTRVWPFAHWPVLVC